MTVKDNETQFGNGGEAADAYYRRTFQSPQIIDYLQSTAE